MEIFFGNDFVSNTAYELFLSFDMCTTLHQACHAKVKASSICWRYLLVVMQYICCFSQKYNSWFDLFVCVCNLKLKLAVWKMPILVIYFVDPLKWFQSACFLLYFCICCFIVDYIFLMLIFDIFPWLWE